MTRSDGSAWPLIVDLFAGFGGASLGIRDALGRDPDIAINHDEVAVAVHAANHPGTRHLHGDVWHYDPKEVCSGRRVGLLWASPTCIYFSKAKGGPLDRKVATRVRALAWVVTRWAKDVRPDVIAIENVEAFAGWGPLTNEGQPCRKRTGATFRRWVRSLEVLGYRVEWRELVACDYGAPTSRKRLFIVARCDGQPITWPEPTHGPGLLPHRAAAEVIDWSLPCPSIFERKRPLAEKTLARIARGVERFVCAADVPFVVPSEQGFRGSTLIQTGYGERPGQTPRVPGLDRPLGTAVAGGVKHAVVSAFFAKHYGGVVGIKATQPLSTITVRDHHSLVTSHMLKPGSCSATGHASEVRALLQRFEQQAPQLSLDARPLGTARIRGEIYRVVDIGMRMLEPRELARAHDFDDSLELERDVAGKPVTKGDQIRLIGNSVPRKMAAAIVSANLCRSRSAAA